MAYIFLGIDAALAAIFILKIAGQIRFNRVVDRRIEDLRIFRIIGRGPQQKLPTHRAVRT